MLALESSKATDLGLNACMGTNIFTSSRIELAAVKSIAVDAIKINGQNARCNTISLLLWLQQLAAKLLADAINTNTANPRRSCNSF